MFREFLKFVETTLTDGTERDPDDLYDFLQDFIIPFATEYGIELPEGIKTFVEKHENQLDHS